MAKCATEYKRPKHDEKLICPRCKVDITPWVSVRVMQGVIKRKNQQLRVAMVRAEGVWAKSILHRLENLAKWGIKYAQRGLIMRQRAESRELDRLLERLFVHVFNPTGNVAVNSQRNLWAGEESRLKAEWKKELAEFFKLDMPVEVETDGKTETVSTDWRDTF